MQQKVKVYRKVSTADTNAAVIQSGATELKSVAAFVSSSGEGYIKLYNQSTTPDENDTPVLTLSAESQGPVDIPGRLVFDQGLSIRITALATDLDTTVLTAAEVVANIFYI